MQQFQSEQKMAVPTDENHQLMASQDYKQWIAPRNLDGYESQAEFFCTRCQQKRLSLIQSKPGKGTVACCCCLCLMTIVLGLLPFYISDCQDKVHICPVCSTYIGQKEFKPC